jgi:hypothetical protein
VEEIEEGTNSGDFGKDYPDYTYKQEVSEVPDTDGVWSQVAAGSPEEMCAVGSRLYADFGVHGLYR